MPTISKMRKIANTYRVVHKLDCECANCFIGRDQFFVDPNKEKRDELRKRIKQASDEYWAALRLGDDDEAIMWHKRGAKFREELRKL